MNDLQIIGESFNDNFTIVPNELLEASKLSPTTRLFVIYCLSKPDNWTLRKTHVMKSLGFTGGMWKRAMKELKDLKIIQIEKPRDPETNQFTGGTIYILDRDKLREVNFHMSGNPQRGKPTTRETEPLSNTESFNKKEEEERLSSFSFFELIKSTMNACNKTFDDIKIQETAKQLKEGNYAPDDMKLLAQWIIDSEWANKHPRSFLSANYLQSAKDAYEATAIKPMRRFY